MYILVTNDDGIHAPGINILAESLTQIAKVDVVAPDRNRSGASHSLTLHDPLRAEQLDNGYIRITGTPTDCVHLAVTGFLEAKPDIVLSGINDGANLGDDILYSGTVAAAMEGRFLGYPSIAISLIRGEEPHYETAASVAKNLVLQLQSDPLPTETILNVNVPNVPLNEIKGYEVTRLGTRHYAEPVITAKDPADKTIYWIGPAGPEQDAGFGTDFYAVNNNCVSITPLHVDLTYYKVFDQLSNWIKRFN
ncbi:MAG: 5'/3'-nucleotidase SurE [Gammaproteobacteria bacterium]